LAQLAALYRRPGRATAAINLCREGLQRWPHYTTARLILAKSLLADGQLEPALAEVNAILQTTPKDVQCLRLAAEVHRRAGRLDTAGAHPEKGGGGGPGDRGASPRPSVVRPRAGGPGGAGGRGRGLARRTVVAPA